MRAIHLSNEKKRDAQVGYESKSSKNALTYKTADGGSTINERYLKYTQATSAESLAAQNGDDLTDAILSGDPEIDMEMEGRKLAELKKVYLDPAGKVAYSVTLTEHIFLPDGTEKGTRPQTQSQANVSLDELPLRWTGKLFPKSDALRKFVFTRSYQVCHVNGLTFDFLYDMAKTLAEKKALMLIGAGEKGVGPLVFSKGGTSYRAFLEGRVDGSKYMLILRLTNLELKELPNA